VCTSLTIVTIPFSVTNIGARALSICSSLTTIDVDPQNSAYSALDGVLFDKGQTLLIQYPGGRTGAYIIPDSVTSIEPWGFAECSSMTSVTIPSSVTSVREGTFSRCSGLTSVTIPHSVTSIEEHAFWLSSSLTSVTIGSNVATIQWRAFDGCTSLERIYFRGNVPSSYPSEDIFGEANSVTLYYLPGTTGWGAAVVDQPTALWIPVVPKLPLLTSDNPLRLVTFSPAPSTVHVQRSMNLLDWEDWQTVSRDEGPSELQDLDAGTTPYRFYRGVEE